MRKTVSSIDFIFFVLCLFVFIAYVYCMYILKVYMDLEVDWLTRFDIFRSFSVSEVEVQFLLLCKSANWPALVFASHTSNTRTILLLQRVLAKKRVAENENR